MTAWTELLPAWSAAGASAGGGFFMIKWVAEYIGGRMDKRAAALDAGTQQLINGLQDRLAKVEQRLAAAEQDLDDCRRKHAETEAEAMRLSAMLQGYGDARQHAARIVAIDRLAQGDGT